jgi:hypothetical protein
MCPAGGRFDFHVKFWKRPSMLLSSPRYCTMLLASMGRGLTLIGVYVCMGGLFLIRGFQCLGDITRCNLLPVRPLSASKS